MDTGVVDLLNIIRSKAVGKVSDRDLLSVADSLETLFRTQDDTLQATHTIAGTAHQEIERLSTQLRIAEQKLQLVEERLRLELARRFGRSSEKWTDIDHQQALLFTEIEQILYTPVPETEADEEPVGKPQAKNVNKARGKRDALPASLPRVDVRLDPEEADRCCHTCGRTMQVIGEQIHETLEMKPIEFFVRRKISTVLACNCGEGGVVTAPAEPAVYPKSILGDSVIAQIITSKFADALPFYRQERILARSGIEVSRQTMARAAAAAAEAFAPLYRLIKERLIRSQVIGCDETRVRVLKENGIKKPGLSWMWVLAGVWEEIALVYFHYGGGRDSETARELLSGFSGVLMTDGYTVYPAAVDAKTVTLAACMAHVRRKFHDCLKVQRGNPEAKEAISIIRRLYEIEEQIAHASAAKRT